jgi:RsiW-degrading membrane proteinase PrsW (M82 family)
MLFFAWIIYWLDRYEKEPVRLLGIVFMWGAVIAAGGAFMLNSLLELGIFLFTGSKTASTLATGSLIAPVIEETFKGLAVLMVFLFYHAEFDSILDGIVYAAIVALGFAATENTYYIYEYGFNAGSYQGLLIMVFVRVILVGWQHPFYTAFTGIGFAMARLSRNAWLKFIAPIMGWTISVSTHAIHNILADFMSATGEGLALTTLLDWGGWFLMFLFIIWAIYRERQILVNQLRDEVQTGLITPTQYRTACSAWLQSIARIHAILAGQYPATTRFYQVCAELAHKKIQRIALGDEKGNTIIIAKLRDELNSLSPQACS